MAFWNRDKPASSPFPPLPEMPEPEPVKTSAELLAESVRLLRESLRLEAAESMAPVQASREADEAKLRQARELADSLGLREALAFAVQKLEHRESWIKQDDKYRTPAEGIYIRNGKRVREERKDSIGLLITVDDTPYVIAWERIRGYPDGEIFGPAWFSTEAEEPLFSIDYSTSQRHDIEQIHAGEVTRLQVGEWVHDLVRLHERLRAAEDMAYVQRQADYAAEKAKDI